MSDRAIFKFSKCLKTEPKQKTQNDEWDQPVGERPQELRVPTRFENGASPLEVPIPHPGLQAG